MRNGWPNKGKGRKGNRKEGREKERERERKKRAKQGGKTLVEKPIIIACRFGKNLLCARYMFKNIVYFSCTMLKSPREN